MTVITAYATRAITMKSDRNAAIKASSSLSLIRGVTWRGTGNPVGQRK